MRRQVRILACGVSAMLLTACQHDPNALNDVMLRTVSDAMHSAGVINIAGGLTTGNVKQAAIGVGALAASNAAAYGADRLADKRRLAAARTTKGSAGIITTRDGLPDTPQCRQYLGYAKRAGLPGTMHKLVELYHACLNSAPNHPATKSQRCGPGKYYVYINNTRTCGVSAARQWDAAATAHSLRTLFGR